MAWSGAGVRAAAAGGAGPGKFVSRVPSPGAPAAAAQVLFAGVGMELPTVNLKVATGRAGRGRVPQSVWGRLLFFKKDFRSERIESSGQEGVVGRQRERGPQVGRR